eukprot:43064-Prorocentrum_minimum.AAC.5
MPTAPSPLGSPSLRTASAATSPAATLAPPRALSADWSPIDSVSPCVFADGPGVAFAWALCLASTCMWACLRTEIHASLLAWLYAKPRLRGLT